MLDIEAMREVRYLPPPFRPHPPFLHRAPPPAGTGPLLTTPSSRRQREATYATIEYAMSQQQVAEQMYALCGELDPARSGIIEVRPAPGAFL